MAAVDASASDALDQRLPSTKPIDARWDRSRSIILRNAEHNALRDFRWTHTDPITFAETPGSSRHLRRELTRRSSPGSDQARADAGGHVDRPDQVNISNEDRLNEQVKQLDKKLSEVRKDLAKSRYDISEKDKAIHSYQQKQTERDTELSRREKEMHRRKNEVVEMERMVTQRETVMQATIAENKVKAEKEAEDALHEERTAFLDDRKKQAVALEQEWQNLRDETLNFQSMVEEAQKEADTKAKAAYEQLRADLEKEREDLLREHATKTAALMEEAELLKSGWADLEAKESTFDTKVTDATEAAQAKVRKEHQDLLDSATLKDSSARTKLEEATQHLHDTKTKAKRLLDDATTEAKQLRDDAKRNQEDAITDRTRLAQNYERKMDEELKHFTKFMSTSKEAMVFERRQAIGDFTEKLRNADYRERVERMDYDAYWEVWAAFTGTTYSLSTSLGQISRFQDAAAEDWQKAIRFEPSKIHRSFPSKYPKLAAQIQDYLRSSCEESIKAKNDAYQRVKAMAEDTRSRLVEQSHFARLLTSFTRYEQSQSKGTMMKTLNEVLGNQFVGESINTLGRSKDKLKESLSSITDESEIAKLSADVAEIDKQIASLKAVKVFLSTAASFQFFKHLREDSVPEKEIWDALEPIKKRVAEAANSLRDLKRDYPSFVDRSVVSREEQQEDRVTMSQTVRKLQSERRKYHDVVRETSLFEQQLGEGGERVSTINAKIDGKKNNAYRIMLDKLGILADTTGTRLLATSATSKSTSPHAYRLRERRMRSAVPSRTPPVPPKISPAKPTPSLPSKTDRVLQEKIRKLALRFRDESSDTDDLVKQEAQDELQRLKRESMRYNLRHIKQKRASLLRLPSSSPARLEKLEKNIAGLEKTLDSSSSNSTGPQTSSGADSVDANLPIRKLTRRGRLASVGMAGPARASAPANAAVSSAPERAASATLNFRPTNSQQSWHPIHCHSFRPSGSIPDTKGSAYGANTAMMAKILHTPFRPEPYVPRALHVYSLHSLHTAATNEQNGSDAEADFNPATDSTLPAMHSFDESITLTQSTMETISDPESDDSYEPSDSEDSVAMSEPAEAVSAPSDVEASFQSVASTQEFADALEMQPAANAATAIEQIDSNLTYNISAEDYRRAVMASKSNNAGFWTYKLYKNAEGKTPTVHYCTTLESAETQAKQFLDEPILGFDLEWEVGSSPGKSSIKNCVSLVQIASERKIGLFQLAMFKGDSAEQLMPPSLRKIIETREITKTGVNISGDANRIEKCFGFKMQGIFELSHLYNVVTWSATSPEKVNKKLLKLADQVQNVLLLPLKKDSVRVSKWSLRLRPEQTEYAASDAYAGFRIYHALEARRKKMDPTPPRPAFWEEKKPLVLGDGTVVVPRRVIKKKVDEKGQVVEEEDEEGEEYFDAVETLDPYELDPSATGGIPLEGLSISYPTLPTLAETMAESSATDEAQQPANSSTEPSTTSASTSSATAATDPKPKPTSLTSPAVTAADTWAQHFRTTLPATHNLKTKQAHLRAYHLWHHQRHECRDVASLLRDPPLSVTTVASYVLQTVAEGKERLEGIERERFLGVLGLLPESVRGRYWWVVERIEREGVEV